MTFGLEAHGQEDDSLQNEKNKRRDTAVEQILPAWRRMHREGAEFFIDGEAVRMTDAVSKAVKEDGVYMADYVWGEKGRIEQVRLDKVHTE